MTGDLNDILSRLWAVLPKGWFCEQSPNLTALLTSVGTPWVWLYSSIQYIIAQTRIATATDSWLDLVAVDYFGNQLPRNVNEADALYRGRIQAALLREAATRPAVMAGLASLIGTPPDIFEPAKCRDTGSYGVFSAANQQGCTGLAYGDIGGWGNLNLPLQFFVTTARPQTPGAGVVAGYGTANGGFGAGDASYIDLALLPGTITDQAIEVTLSSLLPANAIAWLRII